MKHRFGSVLDRELYLLSDAVPAQQGCHDEGAVKSGGNTSGGNQIAVHDYTRFARDSAVEMQQVPGSPMCGSHSTAQDSGSSAEQGARANGKQHAAGLGLGPEEREHFTILHKGLLSSTARDDQNIERINFGYRGFGCENQSLDIADRGFCLTDDLDGDVGNSRQDLEGAGEVDLILLFKDEATDGQVFGLACGSRLIGK